MQYRKMLIDDYDKIYLIWMSCKGMGLNNLDDSKEGIKRFLNRNPNTCFVAVEDETINGVIMAGHDGRRGYIYHTAVSPACRYQGIGTKLVDKVLAELQSERITKVALVVFSQNNDGNEFWEKQGFTIRNDLAYRNKSLIEMIRIDT